MISLGELCDGDVVSLTLHNKSIEDLSTGVNLSVCKVNSQVFEEIKKYIHDNEMVVASFNDGTVDAKVKLEEGKILFTTIPYDDGWHIYDGGKEIDKKKIADSFIGVELSEGTHELSFRFFSEGFKCGIIVSIISWIIFVLLIILNPPNSKIEKLLK